MRGELKLGFAVTQDNKTRLSYSEHTPPLQIVRAFDLPDGAVMAHLHNVSGGILSGDSLNMDVALEPGSNVQLTTTSATRVYRAREGEPFSQQVTNVTVGREGLFEYLPDPLIPFAGSRYRQETHITLAENAGLFWWETVAPGRVAHGELFAYDCLEFHVTIDGPAKCIARERSRLEPTRRPLTSAAQMGPYRYFSTFYICHTGIPAAKWRTLENTLGELLRDKTQIGSSVWGVSELASHGLSVRVLSVTGRDVAPGMLAAWQVAKREIYGREAIVPRKIN